MLVRKHKFYSEGRHTVSVGENRRIELLIKKSWEAERLRLGCRTLPPLQDERCLENVMAKLFEAEVTAGE